MPVTTTKRRQRNKSKERGSLIKKYGTFLEGLTRLPNKCRQKMINDAPKDVIDCVGECCLNYIKGNVRLTNAQKRKFQAGKQDIRLCGTIREKENYQSKRRCSARFIVETFTLSNHRISSWWFSTASTTSLMEGRKMAIVPFKLWEDMKRWKEEQIQKPRLPPDPNVSATASLQRDLSSVMANEDLSKAEKSQLYGQTLYKFKTAHEKALKEQSSKLLPPWQRRRHHHPLIRKSINWLWIACLKCLNAKLNFYFPSYKIIPTCPGMKMVLSNCMANLFRDLTSSIW